MSPVATAEDVAAVCDRLHRIGCEAHVSNGRDRTVIGAVGDRDRIQQLPWEAMSGVERAIPVLRPFKLVSRDFQHTDTVVTVGGARIGGGSFAPIAGPCAVETRDQVLRTAEAVKKAGATVLRGDAFKPRTSPYSFQGMGEEGLELLAEAREAFDIPFVAEVVDPRHVELVASYADMIRVGTRNMANFSLLAEVGVAGKPVQLKRGLTATVEEWLNAAEYIFKAGNHEIVLVERGIRTFETAARNTLDITAVPVVKQLSHLPVLIDPSHAAGRRELVAPSGTRRHRRGGRRVHGGRPSRTGVGVGRRGPGAASLRVRRAHGPDACPGRRPRHHALKVRAGGHRHRADRDIDRAWSERSRVGGGGLGSRSHRSGGSTRDGCGEGGGVVRRAGFQQGGSRRPGGAASSHSRPSDPAPHRRPGHRRRRGEAAGGGCRSAPRPFCRRPPYGGEGARRAWSGLSRSLPRLGLGPLRRRRPSRRHSRAVGSGVLAGGPAGGDVGGAPRPGGGGDQPFATATCCSADRIAGRRTRGHGSRLGQLPRPDQGCPVGAGLVVRSAAGEPH